MGFFWSCLYSLTDLLVINVYHFHQVCLIVARFRSLSCSRKQGIKFSSYSTGNFFKEKRTMTKIPRANKEKTKKPASRKSRSYNVFPKQINCHPFRKRLNWNSKSYPNRHLLQKRQKGPKHKLQENYPKSFLLLP